jgi:CBS domain-containing protein
MGEPDRVGQVMIEAVLSIGVDEPVSEALRYFRSYPIHHLPVVRGSKPVGMLSTADMMKLEHFLPHGDTTATSYLDRRISIASLLRGIPVTVQAQQSLRDAAALMALHAVHGLMVVDAHDNLVGIVTTTDIMHAALGTQPGDTPSSDATAAAPASPSLERLHALEEVLRVAQRFVTAGQDEQLHALLVRTIDRAREL